MLYQGKKDGYYLYELTDTDLMWEERDQDTYQIGNVLLFTNKREIALGLEVVKADDLTTAIDYLEGDVKYVESTDTAQLETMVHLKQVLATSEAKAEWLEGNLTDLKADLDSQRCSNQVLIAQLESLREQLSIEQISRNEIIDDLEAVSAETYRKDKELQDTIEAKTRLEQELAAQICELMEINSAYAELQKHLEDRTFGDTKTTGQSDNGAAKSSQLKQKASTSETQVYTSPTGKQIMVHHEFSLPKTKTQRRRASTLASAVRLFFLIVLGLLLFIAGSVIATAHFNDLSLGEALDLTLKLLLPW